MSERARRNIALGLAGEGQARRYLETRGFRFVAANWRADKGQIDLVMSEGDELVFVEVKTRLGEAFGRAEAAVSTRQAQTLLTTAESFVAAHPEWADAIWRIDIVGITLTRDGRINQIVHLPNAILAG